MTRTAYWIIGIITWTVIIGACLLTNECTKTPEQTVDVYLTALENGDAATSWDCLSDSAQHQIYLFYRAAMAMDNPEIPVALRERILAINNLQDIGSLEDFWARLVQEGRTNNWLPKRSAGLETINEHGQWKISELPKFPVGVGTMWLANLKVAQSKAANGLTW